MIDRLLSKKVLILMIIIFFGISIISISTISKASDENDNIVVVLDPGHGGNDPGAVNASKNLIERDLNLKISQYTKQELDKYAGIRVFQTHYGVPTNQTPPTLQERADIANELHADLLVSQHINALDSTTKVQGAEVYVTRDTTQDRFNKDCTRLGNGMLSNLSALGIKNRGIFTKASETYTYPDGVVADWYGIIRNPMFYGIPAIIVEHCYLDSSDTQFIDTDAKLQKIGQADAKAIADFYGLKLRTLDFAVESPDNNVTVSKTIDFSGWAIGPQTNQINIYIDDNLVKSDVDRIERPDIQAQEPGFETTTPKPGFSYQIDTTTLTDGEHKLKAELIGANGEKQTLCRYITVDNSKYVSGIVLDTSTITDLKDSVLNIDYAVLPDTALNKNVIWTSDDEDIVSVDSTGKITLKSTGTANITAKTEEGGYTATCKITVTELQEGQTIEYQEPLKKENSLITGIEPETKTGDVKALVLVNGNLNVIIKDAKDNILKDDDIITTGSRIIITDEEDNVLQEDTAIIFGDINGDGIVNIADLVGVRLEMLSNDKLNSVYLKAGNLAKRVNNLPLGTTLNIADLVAVRQIMLGNLKVI